jgi:Zn-dependent protease/predicted transcriptional regulator
VAGIDIFVHGTFLLLVAYVAFGGLVVGQGAAAVGRGTLLILAVFATVVLHELGHALTARRFGVRTRDITLLPIGGVARLEGMPDKPNQQLLVALAGPAVNLTIALFLFALVQLLQGPVGIESIRHVGGPFLTQLMWINVSLAAFNLLPGFPMDGGRVLRALLAMRLTPERATQVAARVGQGMAVILGILGLYVGPMLTVIAVFIWFGARGEYSMSRAKAALADIAVHQGMIRYFRTLSPGDPLSLATALTVTGFQQDFPVVDGGRLVGVLSHTDVLRALSAKRNPNTPVQQVMRREFETVRPSDGLGGALVRMHEAECDMLMVVERQSVVGILTAENIGERLAIEAAGRRAEVPR